MKNSGVILRMRTEVYAWCNAVLVQGTDETGQEGGKTV